MYQLFLFEAIYCSICGFLGLILFREKPAQPTSPSAVVEREPFCNSFKSVLKEKHFILSAALLGIACGAENTWQTLAQLILSNYGVSSQAVGTYNIINIPTIVVTSILFAIYAGRSKKFKRTLIFLNIVNTIAFAAFIPLITLESAIIGGIINTISYSMIISLIALTTELSAELTFPIA